MDTKRPLITVGRSSALHSKCDGSTPCKDNNGGQHFDTQQQPGLSVRAVCLGHCEAARERWKSPVNFQLAANGLQSFAKTRGKA